MRSTVVRTYLRVALVLFVAVVMPTPDTSAQTLIGQWITGSQDWLDKSGYTPAGTHDGVAQGSGQTWSTDLPGDLTTGNSLSLNGSGVVYIKNTKTSDAGYLNTFDNGISTKFSASCWAKGWPGSWSPYVSKNGEGSGFQVRRYSGNAGPTFTLRGTAGADDPNWGNYDMSTWHHWVATWDSATGARKLYRDNVVIGNMTGDTGTMGLPTTSWLVLGGKDNAGTWQNFVSCQLYDVRIYNYALTAGEVNTIYTAFFSKVSLSNPGSMNMVAGGSTADAYATLAVNGASDADVTLYWGTTDMGKTSVGWNGGTIPLGTKSVGQVITTISGLTAGTRYYFRFSGYNSTLGGLPAWSNAGQIQIPVGIVGYWNFNDGTGTTLTDVTGRGNNGTLYNAPTWISGHTGLYGDYALSFNGSSQRVQVNDVPVLRICNSANKKFTVAFWAYDKGSYYGEPFSYGGGNLLFQTGNYAFDAHQYFWSRNNGSLNMTGPYLTPNAWHFFAWTYDGSASGKGYMDSTATPVVTGNPGGANLTAWGNLHIGCENGNSYWWNGYVDDLIILDVEASPADLALIKAGTYPGMPSLPPPPAPGVWTRTSTGGLWSDTANWQNGIVGFGAGNLADFTTIDIPGDSTVHLDSARTLGNLTFGDADTGSPAGWTLDNNGNDANVLTLQGGATITVNALGSGKSVTISAAVGGSSGLTKDGAGTLLLSGANTYSGTTTTSGGTLSVNALPNGAAFNNGGILEFTGATGTVRLDTGSGSPFNINVTVGNLTVSRNGGSYNQIVKGGAGTLTVANTGTDDGGDLTVNQGTAVLAGNTADWHWYFNTGSITDVAPGAVVKLGSTAWSQVVNAFHMTGGTYDVNGITGGPIPVIDGSGMIVNNGAAATMTLNLNANKAFSGNIIDGTGALAVNLAQGVGTWTLSGNNTYSGATTISSGTLKAGSTMAFSPNSAFTVGTTLDLAGYNNTIAGLTGGGTAQSSVGTAVLTVDNNVADYTFTGPIQDGGGQLGLTKQGSRVLTLTGTKTYTGNTKVLNGTLSINTAYLADTADVYLQTGATLDLNFSGTDTIRSLHIDGQVKEVGTWGAIGSGAAHESGLFSGSGIVNVTIGFNPSTRFMFR